MIKFPKYFLWGAATAAYQVEGNNSNSDWWPWEKSAGKEPSGAACRHYELYEQDFDLAKGLHHNTHRLSIEWSRIEPEEGKFSEDELKHLFTKFGETSIRRIDVALGKGYAFVDLDGEESLKTILADVASTGPYRIKGIDISVEERKQSNKTTMVVRRT